jgi:predicted metal-binding protein
MGGWVVHTIAVCATCPRDGHSADAQFAPHLRAAFRASPVEDYQLQTLHCLGACRQPCTIAFTAPRKWRVRFSRLAPGHLPAVIATAQLYRLSPDGLIARDDLPAGMADCFSAASPEGLLHSRAVAPRPHTPSTDPSQARE